MLELIMTLITYEESLNDKLDMLTSIEICTRNPQVSSACAEIRNSLCGEEVETGREHHLSIIDGLRDSISTKPKRVLDEELL